MACEVLGTAPYLAPEQIFAEAQDGRTDLFSLGVLIFEIVTGRRPCAGQRLRELARRSCAKPHCR